MMWRARCSLAVAVALAVCAAAHAAQTSDPAPMGTTLVALKIDTDAPMSLRTAYQEQPPAVTIEFPSSRVISALPEESVVAKGVIRTITARYEYGRRQQRYLRAIKIGLTAPYTARVRSEAGQIVVEVDHPASVGMTAVEVGVAGGTIAGGTEGPRLSERFRAMQDALASATPVPWSMRLDLTPETAKPAAIEPGALPALPAGPARISRPVPALRASSRSAFPLGAASLVVLAFLAAGWVWIAARGTLFGSWAGRTPSAAALPSSLALIDQLVWRVFERQGYQVVSDGPLPAPPFGTFRVMQKDGIKSALLIIGHQAFIEKGTVDRVVRAMHAANLDQGVLVAAGAFTVPAQRTAKMHRLALIGREQLTELLGISAAGEYVTKQLERQQAQLGEAMATLKQYSDELDTLRRQRNEATWYLGEERARLSTVEAQLQDVTRQLQEHQAELERWQQDAQAFKKQWEESEWYLGESRAHVQHLEAQVAALQETSQRVEAAARERQEANWYLGEERTKREMFEQRCRQLEQELGASRAREQELQAALEQLKQEFIVLRSHGERRVAARARIKDAFVEMLNGSDHPMFTGAVRDVSAAGIGLQTDRELLESIRFRLHVPGHAPIESRAQVVWQHALQDAQGYVSGCRLAELSGDLQASLDAAMKG